MPKVPLLALALLALLGGCDGSDPALTWPQFRGPGGIGVSAEEGLPVKWGPEGDGLRWRTEIPYKGVSSPIVAGSRIFLTGEIQHEEGTDLKIISLELKSGALLWESTVVSRQRESFPPRSVLNNPAGPTPVTDGRLVFAYFGTHLVAVDFKGRIAWSEEIDPAYIELLFYGASSSLVLAGDNVIVFRDRERLDEGVFGWIAAFDKKTGRKRWKVDWEDTCCSYTTPITVEGDGGTRILVALAGRIVAFDAATGTELWRRPQGTQQPVASPAREGDVVCVATGAHNVKATSCWRLGEVEGVPSAQELWTRDRMGPSTGSPVMTKGFLFSLTENGFLRCHDSQTGKQLWRTRLAAGPYHASLVAGDGKVYAVSRHGTVSVFAAANRFNLLAENELPDTDIVASPAIADGCLIVRTGTSVLCIEGEGVQATG